MGSCYGKLAVDYAIKQIGQPCGKSSKYAEEMDAISFYNFPKNGVANSCKIFYDNSILHACTDPTYEEDPEGAKWTALYMLNEPEAPGANDGAGCAQSVRMYQDMDRWYTDPQDFERGDEIYFRRNSAVSKNNPLGVYHTGIIVDWGVFDEGEGFKVVEGNTDGGYVAEKFYTYDDKRIAGAGKPRFDAWEPDSSDNDDDVKPEPVPEPQPTPDPEPEKPVDDYEVVNVSSFLNVREGPGKQYKSIWKLYNGDTVHIYEIKDGWGRIDDYGWVSMDYLKKI